MSINNNYLYYNLKLFDYMDYAKKNYDYEHRYFTNELLH
jgi:hypothetical protein